MSNLVTDYIASLPEYKRKLLATPEGRRAVCKMDLKLFALVYFRKDISSPDTGGKVTFSDFHEDFVLDAKRLMVPSTVPASSRTGWICPRGSGKSTWEMIAIIWLCAYYTDAFIGLFSATTTQSEQMLSNIRSQFNSNELLRADWPDLVKPATKKNEAIKLSDSKQLIMQANGAIVTGRGVITSVLGMRIDGRRPSHLWLDDCEAGESQTTKTDVDKLLVTIQDDIMPLSINAHFVMVGTTTRPGGLAEDLVHAAIGMDHRSWVEDENFVIHYWPAMIEEDGEKRSIWEERWSTEFLKSIEHTRSYAKNYKCLPDPDDYHYWAPQTFIYEDAPDLDYVMLSVDPAVTVKESSDFTGLSVVGYSKATRKTYVLHAEQVKLGGAELRARAAKLLEMYPAISLIYCEVNQGGNLISDLFAPLPVKVKTVSQSVKKEIRAGTALAEYEKGLVVHTRKFADLENQMIRFPNDVHDDLIDSVGSAIIYFSKVGESKSGVKAASGTYR